MDIESLHTNITVDKRIKRLETHLQKTNSILPKLVSKLKSVPFVRHIFISNFYKQKFDLPMRPPLYAFLACIYLQFLQSGPFKYIIPNCTRYFRYIDILLIYPQDLNLNSTIDRLYNVELSIKFTCEIESNNTHPFWMSY